MRNENRQGQCLPEAQRQFVIEDGMGSSEFFLLGHLLLPMAQSLGAVRNQQKWERESGKSSLSAPVWSEQLHLEPLKRGRLDQDLSGF